MKKDKATRDALNATIAASPVESLVICVRATKLTAGCVVKMKAGTMTGWGNSQCVSNVCEPLGEVSLFGHNQHYKDYDVAEILSYPLVENAAN